MPYFKPDRNRKKTNLVFKTNPKVKSKISRVNIKEESKPEIEEENPSEKVSAQQEEVKKDNE